MNKLLPLLLTCLICSGCVERHIVDDVNIITAIGYDTHEDGEIKGTAIIAVYNPDQSIDNLAFTGIGDQSREFMSEIQNKSADPLVNGSIEVALFGKELAESGIRKILDTFQRDANIGGSLFFAIVDGEAKEVLEQSLGNQGTGAYLYTILEHNMLEEDIPLTNIHIFLRSLYEQGRDAFLPYIKLEKDKINVKGVALFKKEKVVMYLGGKDLFFFKTMVMNSRHGSYTLEWEGKNLSINNIVGKRKFTVKNPLTNPEIAIDIKLTGDISEFSGNTIGEEEIKSIEKKFGKLITKEVESLLKQFQKQGIDPVGLGHIAKTNTRNFDFKKWEEVYSDATIHVNAEVVITETGVIK